MVSAMFYNDLHPHKIRLKSKEDARDEANQQSAETKQEHGHSNLSSTPKYNEEDWRHMDFDGAVSKEGAGARI